MSNVAIATRSGSDFMVGLKSAFCGRAKVMYEKHAGNVVVLADNYPLEPQATIRFAEDAEYQCVCGDAALYVLLGVDVANMVPRMPDPLDRQCDRWLRTLQPVCSIHLESKFREANRLMFEQPPRPE